MSKMICNVVIVKTTKWSTHNGDKSPNGQKHKMAKILNWSKPSEDQKNYNRQDPPNPQTIQMNKNQHCNNLKMGKLEKWEQNFEMIKKTKMVRNLKKVTSVCSGA